MAVVVIGLNHRSSPVELRERFAFPESRLPGAMSAIRSSGIASEVVILSTCNRVEIYAETELAPEEAFQALIQFLREEKQFDGPIKDEIYQLPEPASLTHLFQVASGLDSMVLGETEILGQIKQAYQTAFKSKHTGRRLNKTFQKAFNVAKQIRTETQIQRGSVSVGSVAVELAEKIFTTLKDRDVMIIGAGDTGEKTARSLLSRGARGILVSNRSFDRAEQLAQELGGEAVRFDSWEEEFQRVDIVISSTAAPHYVLTRKQIEPILKRRQGRSLLLIDIAVPRDIEPEVNFLEDVYLYNVDDLQAIANDYLQQRKAELSRCESIIAGKVEELLDSLQPSGIQKARGAASNVAHHRSSSRNGSGFRLSAEES